MSQRTMSLRRSGIVACTLAVVAMTPLAFGEDFGTGFTYQGQLKRDGAPVDDDACSLRFWLWNSLEGGTPIGATHTVSPVAVRNGLFAVELNSGGEFGPDAFTGQARWLKIEVKCTGDANFTPLSPRQELTPTPHALALPGFHTERNATSPNLIGGYSGNAVTAGVVAATISGGGRSADENRITDSYGTIGGGMRNQAGNDAGPVSDAPFATVGGGVYNEASGSYTTVAGGDTNTATAASATVGGGYHNTAAGFWATVPGGNWNSAGGNYSFAAGSEAQVRSPADVGGGDVDGDQGTFVWSDATGPIQSTGPNQFLIKATGGVGIGTNDPAGYALNVAGPVNATNLLINGTAVGGGVWSVSGNDIYNDNTGNVGIGMSDPDAKLSVAGDIALPLGGEIRTTRTEHSARTILKTGWATSGVGDFLDLYTPGAGQDNDARVRITEYGRVGIGTTSPVTHLDVTSDSDNLTGLNLKNTTYDQRFLVQVNGTDPGGIDREGNFEIWGTGPGGNHSVFTATTEGCVGIGTTNPYCDPDGSEGLSRVVRLHVVAPPDNPDTLDYAGWFDGMVRVDVLEIAGADLAEKFPVSEEVKPGTVVAIDPDHAGKLRLCRGAYNRRVAGVVSGANDLSVGVVLGNLPGHQNTMPIALSGRVWVHCDTSNGAVKPGDLLTTSDTPGHAMKVTDYPKAQGAIIGKAMTPLNEGETGLVLVLVNLQ